MYRREYQLAQPEYHSRDRSPYQYINQEDVAEPPSCRVQPIDGFDGLDTVSCGHCQQVSKVSHAKICLAVAENNAVGVEAELLRAALAKSQLPELHGMIPCSDMINNCVHSQVISISDLANLGTTQGRTDKTIPAGSFPGVRSVQIPRLTRSCPK